MVTELHLGREGNREHDKHDQIRSDPSAACRFLRGVGDIDNTWARCRGDAVEIQDVDRARWTAERNAVASRGDQTSCMVEVGAIAFSNVAISTNPAELFVEFGLEIKERSPFEVTLVSELSNGYCGYVPTEHAFDEGGYETHRSVFSSRLAKNAGLLITEKSVEMLNQCANA